jgi:hypothetical protein
MTIDLDRLLMPGCCRRLGVIARSMSPAKETMAGLASAILARMDRGKDRL